MDEEEVRRTSSEVGLPRKLESLSVEELTAYAEELTGELERVRAEIERKRSYRAGLDSLFKS